MKAGLYARKMARHTADLTGSPLPRFTYFIENVDRPYEENALSGLSRPEFLMSRVFTEETLHLLRQTNGSVALATGALEELTECIRMLNRHGIPADLWLTTEKDEDGYWNNRGNIDAVEALTHRVLTWIHKEKVAIRRIGFDLEPDVRTLKAYHEKRYGTLLRRMAAGITGGYARDAQRRWEQLIQEILRSTSCGIDLYEMPFAGDYALMRYFLGMYKMPELSSFGEGAEERVHIVRMIYSSVMQYRVIDCPNDRIPAIGILSATEYNPGRDLDGNGVRRPEHLLTDEQLRNDLDALRTMGRTEAYAFALNGAEGIKRLIQAWDG
jgi:hypothetical protein